MTEDSTFWVRWKVSFHYEFYLTILLYLFIIYIYMKKYICFKLALIIIYIYMYSKFVNIWIRRAWFYNFRFWVFWNLYSSIFIFSSSLLCWLLFEILKQLYWFLYILQQWHQDSGSKRQLGLIVSRMTTMFNTAQTYLWMNMFVKWDFPF